MLLQRIVTVVLFVPVVLGALFSPWPILFKVMVELCLLVALVEFFQLVKFPPREKWFGVGLGTIHSTFLLTVPLQGEWLLLEVVLVLCTIFAFYLKFHGELPGVVSRIGTMTLGIFYLATSAPLIGLLRDLEMGATWVMFLLAMTWLNDTAAYFVGHWWGKRKFAAAVSPGKTIEGWLGGFVGSLLGFLAVWYFSNRSVPLLAGLVMALLTGVTGPLGDLAESLLKRGVGAKDSGHVIPGHGGVFDRIDALLFNAPVVYGFALFLK